MESVQPSPPRHDLDDVLRGSRRDPTKDRLKRNSSWTIIKASRDNN